MIQLMLLRLAALVRSSSILSLIDQAILSAANFIMTAVIARQLGPDAFGHFILLYTLMLLLNSVHSSLFVQPHNAIGPSLSHRLYKEYTACTFIVQTVFTVMLGIIILLTGLLSSPFSQIPPAILFTFSAAVVCWQIQEFLRRVFYTERKYALALINDIIAYGSQGIAFIAIPSLFHFSLATALIIIAASSAAGCLHGVLTLRNTLTLPTPASSILEWTSRNWRFGKWLLGGAAAYWSSSQLYPVMIAGFIGTSATGGLRAIQNLFGPFNILVRALDTVAVPKLSESYRAGGVPRMKTTVVILTAPLLALMTTFSILIIVFSQDLVRLVFGNEYESFSWLAIPFAIYYVLTLLNTALSSILRALDRTPAVFLAQVKSAALTLTIGTLIVWRFGLYGSAIGLIASNAIITLSLSRNVGLLLTKATKQKGRYVSLPEDI